MRLSTCLLAPLVLCAGCHSRPSDSSDTDTGPAPQPWSALQEGLPGVLLSVWGSSSADLWAVGADAGDGPELHHWDGSAWSEPDPGVTGGFWWVAGSESYVWFSGEDGLLLRRDRAGGDFDRISTPTTATLFGTWPASDDLAYSAGGFLDEHEGPTGVLLRTEDGVASLVESLPAGIPDEELFFKVWGSSPDDVWVIGDHGSVLHFDGSSWSRTVLPESPRLVTVSGSGPEDVTVVGGTSAGVIFHWDGSTWEDLSPSYSQPLNGVYVSSSGHASACGFFGTAFERVDGAWLGLPAPPDTWDWHGTWIDEQGAIYVAGGDFMDLRDGALYRYMEDPG